MIFLTESIGFNSDFNEVTIHYKNKDIKKNII